MHQNSKDLSSFLSRHNYYHLHVPLLVLDVLRFFQDRPRFFKGMRESQIITVLSKQPFACGDLKSQVKMALNELEKCGFIRRCQRGYRTLGAFARLGLTCQTRKFNGTWNEISNLHRASSADVHKT